MVSENLETGGMGDGGWLVCPHTPLLCMEFVETSVDSAD